MVTILSCKYLDPEFTIESSFSLICLFLTKIFLLICLSFGLAESEISSSDIIHSLILSSICLDVNNRDAMSSIISWLLPSSSSSSIYFLRSLETLKKSATFNRLLAPRVPPRSSLAVASFISCMPKRGGAPFLSIISTASSVSLSLLFISVSEIDISVDSATSLPRSDSHFVFKFSTILSNSRVFIALSSFILFLYCNVLSLQLSLYFWKNLLSR